MKTTIQAVVYESFFKYLRHEFYNDFIKPIIDKEAKNIQKEESKDIWEEPYPDTNINIAKDLFQVTNPLYFHRKYDEEAKQHMEAGYPLYPITIDRKSFSLALKFLLFGKVDKIDDYPELNFSKTANWEKNYNTLLELFIREYFPKGFEKTLEKTSEEKEEIFLDVIKSEADIFESMKIKSLIKNFFNSINEKRYEDAWVLLSHNAQKQYPWNGNFKSFQGSCFNIDSIEIWDFKDFNYSYQTVSFSISYHEEGHLYDISNFIDTSASNRRKPKGLDNYTLHDLETQNLALSAKILSTTLKLFQSTQRSELQKWFFASDPVFHLLEADFAPKKTAGYTDSRRTQIHYTVLQNKWFIESLGSFHISEKFSRDNSTETSHPIV